MQVSELLSPENVIPALAAPSKASLLRALSKRAAEATGLSESAILEALSKREALGSTGVGGGVAIPHAPLQGLSAPFGLLVRLERAVAYEAIDGASVDIVCLILTPASAGKDQINALACVAKRLRSPDVLGGLRMAATREALYAALAER